MGCVNSTPQGFQPTPEEQQRNQEIDKALKDERVKLRKEAKMLLLGAGESGKSTILKQMILIHGPGFTDQERSNYREVVLGNLMQSMWAVVTAIKTKLDLKFENPENVAHAEKIAELANSIAPPALAESTVESIKSLLRDAAFNAALDRSKEYQLSDSARYYFENLDRITSPNFVPTDQDILRSRIKTTGITETTFIINNATYRMFDVGGQRSERKKWIHCFENVTAILFLAAISEYDQVLFEDDTVNRMQESVDLFSSICNSRWFQETAMILFLNKIDVLKEKMKTSPIATFFPEYTGGDSYPEATKFFTSLFQAQNKNGQKAIYVHLTCATDTTQIKFVMAAVRDIVMKDNLADAGLL